MNSPTKLVLLLAAVLAGSMFVKFGFKDAAPAAGRPGGVMPASVAIVASKDITEWREFSGRLRAAEDVQVRPRVSGTIDELHFKEGDIVEKGAQLFTIDLRPYQAAYDQASAGADAAAAQADMALKEQVRAQTLLEQKAMSQREFDEKDNAAKSAAAALKSAEAHKELAALNLEFAEVSSPIRGRAGRPEITVGNMVQAGQQVLTTVQSLDPIYADFDMDEQTYLRVMKSIRSENRGSEMPVFMALADEGEFTREGKIRSFDNQLSLDSGTLRVRAEFDNPDGFLTPGLFVRVRLGGADKKKSLLINDAAIGTDQNRKFVYAVDKEGNVGYRPIVPGPLSEGMRVIEQGLQEGDRIVVNGLMRVHPGMKVQPVIVAMDTLKPAGAPEQEQPEQGPPK